MNTPHSSRNTNTSTYTRALLIEAKELRKNMTPAERKLWHVLKGERLHGIHFRRQHPIAGFIADFYCCRLRLLIEVDGPIHLQSTERDQLRDKAISGHGIKIIRVTNDQVLQDTGAVLNQITKAAQTQYDRHRQL